MIICVFSEVNTFDGLITAPRIQYIDIFGNNFKILMTSTQIYLAILTLILSYLTFLCANGY